MKGQDYILSLITSSKIREDDYSISLNNTDFTKGKIKWPSLIRSNRLFTANQSILKYKVGTLKKSKTKEVIQTIFQIFNK